MKEITKCGISNANDFHSLWKKIYSGLLCKRKKYRPLQAPNANGWSIATSCRPFCHKLSGLLGAINLCIAAMRKFTTNTGLMPLERFGNQRLALFGFRKGVNLISIGLTKVFVVHE